MLGFGGGESRWRWQLRFLGVNTGEQDDIYEHSEFRHGWMEHVLFSTDQDNLVDTVSILWFALNVSLGEGILPRGRKV